MAQIYSKMFFGMRLPKLVIKIATVAIAISAANAYLINKRLSKVIMITKVFLTLTNYAVIRRLIWKPIYELLAAKFKVRDWCFMNYGYSPCIDEDLIQLDASDEINRYPIQLYHYLISKTTVSESNILEVGSGRGGGCWYIHKYFRPKKITGLDIAANAIKLANKYFRAPGIEFIQGDSEHLPFPDNSFDIIINVESSHTYGSMVQFLKEVKRVLKSGGHFLLADIRVSKDYPLLKQQLAESNMQLITEENISENVKRAIEQEEPVKQTRIQQNIPRWLQGIFKEFAGVTGSKAHKQLASGELVYYRFTLKK